MGNHVFICYAHEDWDFVRALAAKLEKLQVSIWLDRRDILHGTNWNQTRDDALYECACCVVILSPAAVVSEQVQGEWVTAFEEQKPVVPILYQSCRIPSRLRLIQRFDFTNGGLENEEILQALLRVLGGGQSETSDLQPTLLRHSRAGGNPGDGQKAGDLVPEQRHTSKVEDQIKRREEPKILTPAPFSEITNNIGIKLILIPAGEFLMGSENGRDNEKPVRKVIISNPFYLGKYPVTQTQWRVVMGNNPSHFQQKEGWIFGKQKDNPEQPVENVSWDDAQEFLQKLGAREGGKTYRLPTEVEWEYACRAGSTRSYCFGDDETKLKEYAWYRENSGNTTHPVGQLKANVWGLHDMHGNVWEWVQDWYGSYEAATAIDLTRPVSGSDRVLRGGGCCYDARNCRSALRGYDTPDYRDNYLGFRLLRTVS